MSSTNIPAYFRHCVVAAKSPQVGYRSAGWHLAIHLEQLVEEDDLEALDAIFDDSSVDLEAALWSWLERALPRCAALIPRARRPSFMKGVLHAVEEGRV